MITEANPIEGNWYCHLDKGQRFFVVAVDKDTRTVEIQHFDGDVEELDFSTWYQMDLEVCEEPDSWSGPFDIDNPDDLGTEITDTRPSDWNSSLGEFESKKKNSSEE